MAFERRGTAISKYTYNPRALHTHMFSGRHNIVRDRDGTLWALIQATTVNLYIMRSTDEGFTWNIIDDYWDSQSHYPRSNSDYAINGPSDALMLADKFNYLYCFHMRRVSTAWALYYGWLNTTDWSTSDVFYSGKSITTDGLMAMCHNTNTMYMLYTKLNGSVYDLIMMKVSPRTVAFSAEYAQHTTLNWENIFDLCCNDDGEVFAIGIDVNNGTAAPTLCFAQFTEATNTWGTPVVIDTAPSTDHFFCNLAIARDGYGNLCATWGEMDAFPSSTTVALRYAISTDKGLNWTVVDVANETGYIPFKDEIMDEYVTINDVIGGYEGGFLITYTQYDDVNDVPRTLVRRLTTTNGSSYILGDQLDITNTPSTWNIVGAKFFDVAEGALMNLVEPGLVRCAYQIDEGNSDTQQSSIPVDIDQDVLSVGPYPITYPSEVGSYIVETAGMDELLVTFEIVDDICKNIDYYAAGRIGEYTTTYYDTFVRDGTAVRILKYEPLQEVLMGDRSSYDEPTETWVNIFIDPLSYDMPQLVQDADNTTKYVEQDIRKVYLPPDMHLSRSFILNKGNFLKRTIWVMLYGGNEYELTQVIPRFINNQITHYECNAYVIGPNYNPFTRLALPSET